MTSRQPPKYVEINVVSGAVYKTGVSPFFLDNKGFSVHGHPFPNGFCTFLWLTTASSVVQQQLTDLKIFPFLYCPVEFAEEITPELPTSNTESKQVFGKPFLLLKIGGASKDTSTPENAVVDCSRESWKQLDLLKAAMDPNQTKLWHTTTSI